MLTRRVFIAGSATALSSAAQADETYPDRFIRMIVPFPAGGPSDIVARIAAKGMAERLGQPVVTENRSGAAGLSGTEDVARARPDGYTILAATVAFTIAPGLYKSLRFDPAKDFVPVGLLGEAPLVLVVGPSVKASSVAAFIALMKASPGTYSYGSSGYGSVDHLGAAWFESRAGVKGLHVPFRGAAPAIEALLAGTVDFLITTKFVLLPHIRSGAIKALAVAAPERAADLPGIPTMREAGLADFDVSAWYCVLAPAAVPPPIVARLNQALTAALANPAAREQMQKLGVDVARDTSPDHLAKFIATETGRWTAVLAAAGVQKQ